MNGIELKTKKIVTTTTVTFTQLPFSQNNPQKHKKLTSFKVI